MRAGSHVEKFSEVFRGQFAVLADQVFHRAGTKQAWGRLGASKNHRSDSVTVGGGLVCRLLIPPTLPSLPAVSVSLRSLEEGPSGWAYTTGLLPDFLREWGGGFCDFRFLSWKVGTWNHPLSIMHNGVAINPQEEIGLLVGQRKWMWACVPCNWLV